MRFVKQTSMHRSEQGPVLILRDALGAALQVLETAPFFSFHHVNAFEVEGDRIILDTLAWDTLSFSMNTDTLGPEYYQ